MTISKKILMGFGFITFLMVGITYISFSNLTRGQTGEIARNYFAWMERVDNLKTSLLDFQKARIVYESRKTALNSEDVIKKINGMKVLVHNLRTTIHDQKATEHIAGIASVLNDYSDYLTGGNAENTVPSEPEKLIFTRLHGIQTLFGRNLNVQQVNSTQQQKSTFYRMVVIFSIIIVFSLFLGLFISRNISTEIENVSKQLNQDSEEILETAAYDEKISMNQSVSLNQTATTLEQLTLTAKMVAENAKEVTKLAEINEERMQDLQHKTVEIGKITTAIEEITQQINILSLNASIEAARAGEQGMGFSVVASEIRKLAENTRKSTDNIIKLISVIQNSAQLTFESTNKAVGSVKEISNSISKQDTATEQISETVSRINTGMKKSVEGIRKTVVAAENLHELAVKLQKMV